MRCSEIVPPFKCYTVSVRLKSGITAKTLIFAETSVMARDIAGTLYGSNNVYGFVMSEDVNEDQMPTATPDPAKTRIKALSAQKIQIDQQLATVRAQDKMKKARQAVAKASQPRRP